MTAVEGARESSASHWVRCEGCEGLLYAKRFIRMLKVCPECARHGRLTAPERLDQLLDPGSAVPIRGGPTVHDPLEFVDSRPYPDRLRDARADTGLSDAAVSVSGLIEGHPVVAVAMDFRFLGGSLGCAVGAMIAQAAATSLARRVPLLVVTASGGARMQEGVLSLMQMAKTAQAFAALDEAGILTVSLITDPTYGGVAASFASLADVIFAEPGARMGFAGPRVIEQTIGERLPEGFQTAEFLLRHGMVDDVVPRAGLRSALARVLSIGDRSPADPAPGSPSAVVEGVVEGAGEAIFRTADQLTERAAWDTVRLARHPERPTTPDYIRHVVDDFQELHGDRLAEDCPAIVGGTGLVAGIPVMLIGHHKGGPDLTERRRRRFGMATPAGYRKAARLMRMAAKLGLPVVTLIDTPGANPGPDAERAGQAVAIAENLRLMARLPVPIVAVLTGEGGSGGALALAVADRVLVSANGMYSVISPEGCAAILWKAPEAATTAAAALRVQAGDLLRLGIVDGVVPEPPDGAHRDSAGAAVLLESALKATLQELMPWDPQRLIAERRDRFHRFGTEEAESVGPEERSRP
ncbi:acetyl-CoA carboxylase, carboxyltransferase subunit beta [Catenulispora rubra]|uniref:acetyl-CoA carboxylase, carboxyltransferase subunit beta n=1 Tax=Catenulispora rubra TaxID=280293 RepID=UPI0018926FF8|nr:acetyl-CoA carboxylase, carboxyltransferase subunit beta [Catenulispora rubra]